MIKAFSPQEITIKTQTWQQSALEKKKRTPEMPLAKTVEAVA
jgi:hypothetical protein